MKVFYSNNEKYAVLLTLTHALVVKINSKCIEQVNMLALPGNREHKHATSLTIQKILS
jgi:hypothetical protein